MSGGPNSPATSSLLKPSGALGDAPVDKCLAAVAMEVQTVKASNQELPLVSQPVSEMKKQPETHPISHVQLVAEVKGIYAGLVMVENVCIETDTDQMRQVHGPLDITRYLLMIPESKLIQLQNGGKRPEKTVRAWYIEVHKDATMDSPATSEDSSMTPSTTTDTLATASEDCPATSEEATAHPYVSEKTAPQIGSDEDYLHGFQVALEKRAEELGWPEYEELAAVTTAEIGEEGRQKVIDGKHFLAIGYELVDQFLRDFESIKEKAAEAKAEQEATQAIEDNKDSNSNPEAPPTGVGETPDNPKAQSRPSNHTQQTAPQENAFEETDSQKAKDASKKVASEEAASTQQHLSQDANQSMQEPQASPEEPSAPLQDSGKDTADTAVDTTAQARSEKKHHTKLPSFVDFRPLSNKRRYKKVGKEIWVLVGGQWVPSLTAEQFAALTAIHGTLLHEHYDFFLASQHPNASAALTRLAAKYTMPARMWRHAIQTFLELMRQRLVESQEFMDGFIILAYQMLSLLDETVPRFLDTWIECKGDIARYGMSTQTNDNVSWQRWRDISREEYTRALGENLTTGRLYHHLAVLEEPRNKVSPDEYFGATVSQLFYYTKSLVVKTPFFNTRDSVLILVGRIVARNEKEAEKPADVPQTDKDYFLTAVAHLILAPMEPETLRKNGYKDSRNDHVQAVYAALEKIKPGGSSNTSRISPSPQLGLLLCQLLLGIPLVDNRRSPMMVAWAPDLVTAEDRADADAMANARDIHDATIELIRTMIPYLLEDADTRDLRVWGFIYVILVFMRSLKTRSDLLEWLGPAFHAQLLEPYLNMLLREDETRGGLALERASQWEIVTICSPLNGREKPGKYGLSAEDSCRKYFRAQEKQRYAKSIKSTATAGEAMAATEKTTASAEHERQWDTKRPDLEPNFASPLPEHFLLGGLPFAREAGPEPCDRFRDKTTEHAAVVASLSSPKVTTEAVQTSGEPAVEHQQEASVTDPKTESSADEGFLTRSTTDSEAEYDFLTDSGLENDSEYEVLKVLESESQAQDREQTKEKTVEAPPAEVEMKETEGEKTQGEDEQNVKEAEEGRLAEEERKKRGAEEADVQRQQELRHDRPLFPVGWLKKSRYSFDEMLALNYVQSVEMCNDRSTQILCLAAQLNGSFFVFEPDEKGRYWIRELGTSSAPNFDPNKKMPEVIERDGGVRVVYVHPSFHTAEIERETKRTAWRAKGQKEMQRREEEERQEEKDKEAKTTTDAAKAVHEEAEGDAVEQATRSEEPVSRVNAEEATEAVNVPAGAPIAISDDDDYDPVSADDMELWKASKLSNSRETEPDESEVETTPSPPVQGVYEHGGQDAAAAAVPTEEPARDPHASVQLTEGVLDKIPSVEGSNKVIERWRTSNEVSRADEESWVEVGGEIHGDAETVPTA